LKKRGWSANVPRPGDSIDSVSKAMPQLVIEHIVQALKGIRYGAVQIVIHDGQIVQIERKEKVRLDVSSDKRASR
jgi:hypothetical protein